MIEVAVKKEVSKPIIALILYEAYRGLVYIGFVNLVNLEQGIFRKYFIFIT